jgi:hypothetical protein
LSSQHTYLIRVEPVVMLVPSDHLKFVCNAWTQVSHSVRCRLEIVD